MVQPSLGLKDVFFKVEREINDVILILMCFHKITLGNVVKGVGAVYIICSGWVALLIKQSKE